MGFQRWEIRGSTCGASCSIAHAKALYLNVMAQWPKISPVNTSMIQRFVHRFPLTFHRIPKLILLTHAPCLHVSKLQWTRAWNACLDEQLTELNMSQHHMTELNRWQARSTVDDSGMFSHDPSRDAAQKTAVRSALLSQLSAEAGARCERGASSAGLAD